MAVFSEVDIGKASALNILDRLEESTDYNPAMVLVRESKLKHKNLLRLEEVTKYMQENNFGLREALDSIAKVNNLNMESFGFAVFPISLIEDCSVYKNTILLKEEGFPIYINQNPGDILNQCLDTLITEAAASGNTEEFDKFVDALDEGFMDAIFNPAAKRASANLAASTIGATGHVIANGAREGLLKGAENIVNRRAFGYFNNKTESDPTDPSGHRKISKFDAKLQQHVPNQDARDLIKGVTNGVTGELSKAGINKLYQVLRYGGSSTNPQQALNDLQHKTAVLSSRIGNTKDPRTRNVLQRMYDKLINLKNKLMARIRGQKNK